MPLRGQGALAIWNAITPEGAADFYRWHNTEHIPERVGVPGFLRGRRYLNPETPLDFFTLYETQSADTIRSAPYLARLNDPTPWTRRVLPHFRATMRIGCRVAASSGHGQGGGLLALRLFPREARPGWADAEVTATARSAGVVAAHLLEPVPETTQIQTKEKELRGAQPGEAEARQPWVLLVELNGAEQGRALLGGPLARLAAQPETGTAVYRLEFSLDRAS
jgi:hypothetical protein